MNLKISTFLSLGMGFLLIANGCKSEAKVEQKAEKVSVTTSKVPKDFTFSLYQGHWMDKTFFETLKKERSFTSVKDVPNILELIFPSEYNDSLWCASSSQCVKTKVVPKTADSLVFKDGILSYNNTAGIEVLDWTDTKGKKRVFERVTDVSEPQSNASPSILTAMINRNTLTGDYFRMDEKGRKTDDFVVFKADGTIIGWDFSKYKVCYTKDCLQLAGEPIDVLYLSILDKDGEYFAWEIIDYDEINNSDDSKTNTKTNTKTKSSKKKKYGLVLALYKIKTDKDLKSGSFKKDKPDYEFTVNKLG